VKIKEITTATVSGEVFDWIFVKVDTDDGISGIGEAYAGTSVKEVISKLKPFLIGENPLDIDRLFQKMYRAFQRETGISLLSAISGIETALCDIVGKALRVPVYSLIGGKYRDKIRVYADCASGAGEKQEEVKIGPITLKGVFTPQAFAEKARTMKTKGYTALKFDLDLPPRYRLDQYNRSITNDELNLKVKLVEAVRAEVGSSIDIAVDCHWQYSVKDAIRISMKLEPYDLLWLEDPVPAQNVRAMRKVSAASRIPICTGEQLISRYGFQELIETQAASIISPDTQKAGGIFETKKIADMAEVYYVPIAPHNIASPIGTIASTHLCAAIPNFLVLEFHADGISWWQDLIKYENSPLIDGGFIRVPNKPGLGVDLNFETVRRHLKRGESLFGKTQSSRDRPI
jgi:L-alanine-DL-glutamate epimerase-like enolase superfamily enzyme